MSKAVIIRISGAAGADALADRIAENIEKELGGLVAVDVIGWPPAPAEVQRLIDPT